MLQFKHVPALVAACLWVSGCASENNTDATNSRDDAAVRGFVDTSFAEATKGLRFRKIGGLAASNSLVGVADVVTNRVLVLLSTGEVKVADSADRWGNWAGLELAKPCCLAFAADERLWIRDNGNGRYAVFRIGGDSAVFEDAVPIRHGTVSSAPTTFDQGGRLIDIGEDRDSVSDFVTTRLFQDDSGHVVLRQIIPQPTPSVLGAFVIRHFGTSSTTSAYFYPPEGPKYLIAHGPRGVWAEALSSSYSVTLHDGTGRVMHTISQALRGPRLTRAQRDRDRKALRADEQYAQRRLPFKVPETQTPLRNLFFDDAGRLWVQRSTPPGARNVADVWEEGALLSTVSWPAEIRLDRGAIRRDFAIGVAPIGENLERLVRVNFQLAASGSQTALKLP